MLLLFLRLCQTLNMRVIDNQRTPPVKCWQPPWRAHAGGDAVRSNRKRQDKQKNANT